jgi:hypothetical protein
MQSPDDSVIAIFKPVQTERIKAAKVMFSNKQQLLCANNLSLEIK